MIKRKPFKNIFIVFLKTIGNFLQKRSTTFVEKLDNRCQIHQVDAEIQFMWFNGWLMIKRKHFENILIMFLQKLNNFFQ